MKLSAEMTKFKNSILREYQITDDAGKKILQTACESYDLVNKAQREIEKHGLTVKGDRGQVKAHPLLAVIRDSRAQFLMALKHLNLDLEPLKNSKGR